MSNSTKPNINRYQREQALVCCEGCGRDTKHNSGLCDDCRIPGFRRGEIDELPPLRASKPVIE